MELPEIYKNKIDNDGNNRSTSITKNNQKQSETITDILKELPITVYILTKNRELTCTIIDKTQNYIITKNRNVIYIKDIINIKRI